MSLRRIVIILWASVWFCTVLVSDLWATQVRFEGLKRVHPTLIEEEVQLFSQRVVGLSPQQVVTDSESSQLIATLYATGFFDAINVYIEDGVIIVSVKERPIVRSVKIDGVEELGDDEKEAAIQIREGEFFDANKLVETKRALRSAYEKEGMQDVNIQAITSETTLGDIRIAIEVDENSKVKIRSIEIMGNVHFTDDELVGRIQSSPRDILSFVTSSGVYDPNVLNYDLQRIDASYQQEGFLKVQVNPPVVTWQPDKKWVDIVFSLEENIRYKLGEVSFTGDLIFSNDLLRDQLNLDIGEWANRMLIEESVQRITDLYSNLGYAFVRVSPQFNFDDDGRIVNIQYIIDKGKPVYFRLIRIRGNTKTRDKVIRREMTIEEGQLFNGRRLRQSRERVFALGFFEDVSMTTRAFGPEQMDITVLVQEKSTGTVSAGLGFSSVDSFVGTLKLNFGNLLGYGIRLDFNGEIGARRKNLTVSYADPYFLDSKVSFGIDLFYNNQQYFLTNDSELGYEQIRIGGSMTLGYLIGLYTRSFIGYRYEYVDSTSEDVTNTRFNQKGKTSAIQLTLRRDSKNHPYDPTSGSINMIRAEIAGQALQGDYIFEKYTGLTQWFMNPFWKIVLMLRAEVGLATSRAKEEIPFAERYFLGGIYSVRGYQARSIGPSLTELDNYDSPLGGSHDVNIGGNKQFFANAEIVFPILPQAGIKGVLFFDGGNTWLEQQEYFSSKLKYGYGFGIRWFSPIGPLRFEWGYPLSPESGQRKSVFEFTIGTFF